MFKRIIALNNHKFTNYNNLYIVINFFKNMAGNRKFFDFEGDLSRRLTFPGAGSLGVQDASGLAIDALNVWPNLIPEGKARDMVREKFARPFLTYEKYYRVARPQHWKEIMSVAKPDSLQEFDTQITEYNTLPVEEKIDRWKEYHDRCEAIIMNGSLEEK